MTDKKPAYPSADKIAADIAGWLRIGDVEEYSVATEGPLNRDLVLTLRLRFHEDKASDGSSNPADVLREVLRSRGVLTPDIDRRLDHMRAFCEER